MRSLVLLTALVACVPPGGGQHTPAWISDTSSYGTQGPPPAPAPAPRSTIAQTYGATAAKILATARADRGAYAKLTELTDQIGHRLSGSPQLTRAIAWAVDTMRADGHEARTEKVMVPHWVRGTEQASILTPVARPLKVLGLGGTPSTPKGGITAPVVVVTSFEDLAAKAAQVKGAIVLYNVAMPPYSTEKGSGYGEVAPYRSVGPTRAAKLGAVGVLMRSVTANSLHTVHTGAMSTAAENPRIPAAAVTVEDALLIARLAAKGPVTVRLQLESKQLPDAESANVIGELRGREKPDEIVLIGAHLDSWDVGQGAHDDGAGCVMMMQAITLLKQLGLQPRRTIRVVLFTNEENGLRGAKAYAAEHAAELPRTVLAIESDIGGFSPRGFTVETKPEVFARTHARVVEIAQLLAPLGPMKIVAGGSGADVGQLVPAGVPGLGLITDARTYFDIHHTEADTLDKVDPQQLADATAAIAVMAYIVADMPERIDAP